MPGQSVSKRTQHLSDNGRDKDKRIQFDIFLVCNCNMFASNSLQSSQNDGHKNSLLL